MSFINYRFHNIKDVMTKSFKTHLTSVLIAE